MIRKTEVEGPFVRRAFREPATSQARETRPYAPHTRLEHLDERILTMAFESVPPSDFSQAQQAAFALAGTVALPSPFPASGMVSIGLFPPHEGAKEGEVRRRFYLKSVQIVSEKHIVTRFVHLEDFRAVRLLPDKRSHAEWERCPIQTAEEVRELIDAKKRILIANSMTGGPSEVELFAERAILYVPESARVLHRVEIGMAAAQSAEHTFFAPHSFLCESEPFCPQGHAERQDY
jgi:hypothetical protein